MKKIKIICDTMSDLQPGIAEKYDINRLPANIIFNEKGETLEAKVKFFLAKNDISWYNIEN